MDTSHPAQPAKASKTWLWVVGGIIGVVVVIAALSGGGDKDKPATSTSASSRPASVGQATPSAAAEEAQSAAAPGIGAAASDGQFEFIVTSASRASSIGDSLWKETAKGEFFVVHLKVLNTGSEARQFFAANQHLIIGGNKYDATTVIGGDADMEKINPGLGIETTVAFDVPVGSQPEAVELHDSAFSGGVTIRLG